VSARSRAATLCCWHVLTDVITDFEKNAWFLRATLA
jgi:hypothetical protein